MLESLNFIEMIFFYNIFNLRSIEIFLMSLDGNETEIMERHRKARCMSITYGVSYGILVTLLSGVLFATLYLS